MSLNEYTPTQTEMINKLLGLPNSPLHTLNSNLPDWEEFRRTFWGPNSVPFRVEAVDRDDEPVPSDPPPTTRSTLTVPEPILSEWASKSRKILVRSEYEETKEAARSANNEWKDAFVVAGQPGIGVSPSHPIIHRI